MRPAALVVRAVEDDPGTNHIVPASPGCERA